MNVFENHPLAPHTTLHIGGKAKRYVEPQTRDELVQAVQMAHENEWPIFFLGGGSNTLIHDDGFDGLVIHLTNKGIEFTEDGQNTRVKIQAGEIFDDVVAATCAKNLGGIESLSGIPGSAGGAAVQNIGAYGQELSETFLEAEAFDTDTMTFATLSRSEMHYAYRHSALKSPNNHKLIVSVTLRLANFDPEKAVAVANEHGFKKIALMPPKTASDMRRRVLETRRTKGMCYDDNDVDTHSVGSFFVNPVVSQNEATRINSQQLIAMTNMSNDKKVMPMYPAEGGVKLSAAWLIEQAGFSRGYRFEKAALSSKHCLALINPGDASAKNIVNLATRIAQTVFIKYRVELNPEIVYLTPDGITPLKFNFDISKLASNVQNSAMATF